MSRSLSSRTPPPITSLVILWAGWACAQAASRSTPSAGAAAPPRPLEVALENALRDPATRSSLRLLVECPGDDAGLDSLELFGRGVGIADGRRQFEAPAALVTAVVTALRDSRFPAMPETFGGVGGDPARPPAAERRSAGSAVKVVCRIELTVGAHRHSSLQLARGYQSPALRRLALELLRICEEPARGGLEATDLADGLVKLSDRQLAPEVLRLVFNHRHEQATGVLLRLDGRLATARAWAAATGYGPAIELPLDADEARELASALATADLGNLPVNLWSPAYTDLSVTVLAHTVALQARRFAGRGPSTDVAARRSFGQVQTALTELAGRVLAEGRPSPSR